MSWKYLDQPEQWDAVVKACYEKKVVGLDTETYAHNVKTSTPAYRAKIDVWSLALATSVLHPRGYHIARACVLPLEAANFPPMRRMLESHEILHVFHNAHHDQHAFANHGILVGDVFDTLDAVRLAYPSLACSYSIKPLRVELLGKTDRTKFKSTKKELSKQGSTQLTDPIDEEYQVEVETKVCGCGVEKCRKRKGHEKFLIKNWVTKTRKVPCPIENIGPGHVRWSMKVDYAGDDAADGLELYELVQKKIRETEPRLPNIPWEIPTET